MKTAINEGKTLEKHILWSCTCKFDGRKCYLKEKCSDELCLYECKKKTLCMKKIILGILAYRIVRRICKIMTRIVRLVDIQKSAPA